MKNTMRWSILFALLLVCVMIPCLAAGASAAEAESYNLWVGNTEVTSANLSGAGWTYDPGSRTLTLSDPVITGSHAVGDSTEKAKIYAAGTLTVTGTGTLSGADYGVYVTMDVTGACSLTLKDADLTVTSSKACFWAGGEITIEDSTVDATSTNGSAFEKSWGNIKVSGTSKVTADGKAAGFEVLANSILYIEGGEVTATG
ncbi:MAG: hypothetical protein IKQ92_10385, partial [Clostridia bacterium]|nr:hypothetical protein [Clostridia bacterium]